MKKRKVVLPKSFLNKKKDSILLLHQEATLNSLKEHDIVVNDAQTGSGKTRGALLYLKELEGLISKNFFAVLYVAPVNSLISEKTEDIYKFLKKKDLDYQVFPITSFTMREIKNVCKEDKYFTGNIYSNGELLTHFFKDPVSILPYMSETLKKVLNIKDEMEYKSKPFIFLINPDILYYALFGDYYAKHKQNINLEMLENIQYIIFDEFHFYTYFQLTSFFALLSYWKMLGYIGNSSSNFKKNVKKIKTCLLSATPNQFIYETITEKLGLDLKIVNNRSLENNCDTELIPFLAETNLYLQKISNKTSFKQVMSSSQIKTIISNYLKKGKYGLIICNSIKTANELYDLYNVCFPNRFSRITGAITHEDRKIAVNSQIIIATSTVDLGFNFRRENQPDRQNIDFLFIDHFTYDDFIQRLGRGGRILGKTILNQKTDAYIFLYDSSFDLCTNILESNNVKNKSRLEILELIQSAFPERNFYFNFFKEYGYFLVYSFVNMFREWSLSQNYSQSNSNKNQIVKSIISNWEDLLKRIFCAEKQEKKFNRLIILYNISKKKKNFKDLSEKEQHSIAYHWIKDNEYRHSDPSQRNGFEIILYWAKKKRSEAGLPEVNLFRKDILNFVKSEWDKGLAKSISNNKGFYSLLNKYLSYQRIFFNALRNNFRSSADINISIKIYDPNNDFGSNLFNYNIFHVMQYFNYYIENDYKKKPQIRINSRLSDYNYLYFNLDLRDGIDRETFEKGINEQRIGQFLWKNIHFYNSKIISGTGYLHLKFENGNPPFPIALKESLKKDLIGYVVPFNWNYLKKMNISRLSPYKLVVNFNNNSENYFIFFGKNALIAKSVITAKEFDD